MPRSYAHNDLCCFYIVSGKKWTDSILAIVVEVTAKNTIGSSFQTWCVYHVQKCLSEGAAIFLDLCGFYT